MSAVGKWTIVGEHLLADEIRNAARFVPAESAMTIDLGGESIDPGSFVLGPAALRSSAERFVPYFAAFEAVETLQRAVLSGDVGRIYGCFVSYRIQRGTAGDDLVANAVLPAVGIALDTLRTPVTRVWAQRSSLFAENDAWFITLRLEDETIITLEAMASNDATSGGELLIEVTGSDRVLRAEPMRQSVVVESLGVAPTVHGWWEDLGERYLHLISERAKQDHRNAGSRVRAVWSAIEQSLESGNPVSL